MKQFVPRLIITTVLCVAMMTALIVRLGTLTLAEGTGLSQQAEERSLRTVTLKGTRGRILDKNGIVLAYDETCYNVEFLRDADHRTDYYSAIYTESLMKTIKIIEDNGGKTIDTSYIRMDDSGALYYDWGVENEDSQAKRYYNFCSAMGFYVTDEIVADRTKWKTPKSAYEDMCKSWFIPPETPFSEAIKVISVRQEVLLNNYQAYTPITIAYNVSIEAVAQIQMRAEELVGILVSESTTRVYPQGETAAHIVGYLQRAVTEEMMDESGYAYDDYVGVSGIEYTMEEYLTGATTEHHGSRVIKVNRNGSQIELISESPATDGNDVMLTIDLPLQQVVDKALKDLIAEINAKEAQLIADDAQELIDNPDKTKGKYTERDSNGEIVYKDIGMAETGAIVVLDIHTGDVLAMSSYPSYDPNVFMSPLSDEMADMLMGESAKDTTPMRNKAVSARLAPGSIFKMLTGFAGLIENKITLDERIDDNSPYVLYYDDDGNPILTDAPKCWTSDPSKHSNQNISAAITNSCNYYFYEVAHRLGIDLLNDWAGKFGLTSSTGIETTGEAIGIIGGQSVWYDCNIPLDNQKTSMPRYIYNRLREKLEVYAKLYIPGTTLTKDSDEIKDAALRLLELQDGDVSGKGAEVRSIINEYVGIPEGIIKQAWITEILSDLVELQWKESQTIRSGIGQGSTLVTPVAIARYFAAIANGGTVYNVHVVNSVTAEDGTTILDVEPDVYNRIEAPAEYWTAIRDGLKGVVSPEDRGTAAAAWSKKFLDSGYISLISGKTGSAQIGTTDKMDIENTSWFLAFTPREDPEIAIVVCVPYGYSGSSSAAAIEDIITYYYERKDAAAPENLIDINSITP